MKQLYIIKLGGSVITNKSQNKFEIFEDKIHQISSEIKKAKSQKQFSLIIIHGVGPFGHELVKQYNINNGVSSPLQFEGFQKTHESVCNLNKNITQLLSKQLPDIFPIMPLDIFTTDNKKINSANLDQIITALNNNKIPILFGDMVVDNSLTAAPLSGDTIACYLAKHLNAKFLFFGTDVDGVLGNNNNNNNKIIPELTKNNISKHLNQIQGSKHVDVTGGMKKKIDDITDYSAKYTTYIFNLNKPNIL